MKGRKFVSICMVFLCVSASALGNNTDTLQDALERIMHQHKIPDLSVSIIRSGKVIYKADLHQQRDGALQTGPGTTRFRIASITKLFTAQATMQLVEKGQLTLDDKVSIYLPEFKNSQITIRHLLTHYGGLDDKVWPETFNKDAPFGRYLKKVMEVNPDINEDSTFQYSDTGYNLLGHIIAIVSGLPYPTYIERNILKPAMMRDSGYYSGPNGAKPDVEPFKDGQLIPSDQQWPFDSRFFPSDGLITNVSDLSRWAKTILMTSPQLLTKNSYQQMLTPLSKTDAEKSRIGLGWFVTRRNRIEYAYHMGGIRGYESLLVIEPKTNNAIILLTNSSDVPRWEIIDLVESVMKTETFTE